MLSCHLFGSILSSFFLFDIIEKTVFVTADEDRTDIAMVMMTTKKMVASDARSRHATAIIMLGVIGAEFQKEIDPINSKGQCLNDFASNVNFDKPKMRNIFQFKFKILNCGSHK